MVQLKILIVTYEVSFLSYKVVIVKEKVVSVKEKVVDSLALNFHSFNEHQCCSQCPRLLISYSSANFKENSFVEFVLL